ncbi:unnamed protein product [Darwinula stevensoni]|uniref:Protein cornichon n=1 Tax=Darwinula stevensoni TaxID=69355 RepID=A0A7R9FPQ8_9CRUS|nr:unnamed protein product [Darwinula stevensoni]CAG0897962.1 unnamed protein product [Darwinula stevensoni]
MPLNSRNLHESLLQLVLPEYVIHAIATLLCFLRGSGPPVNKHPHARIPRQQIIAFDELKTDYKNPIDQCQSLNPLVLPEYGIHIFFNLLFLFCGEWITLMVNIPLIAYNINRYKNRPVMSGPGLYDPTSIMNADVLTKCQREGWFKLAFYVFCFFYYLYG